MSSYSERANAIIGERRREVFKAWLATLPARGWSGTAGELYADLTEFLAGHPLCHGTHFPAGAGLSKWMCEVTDVIRAAGRELRFTRTKSERRITIG
jgi:hypothetical protein